MGVLKETSQKLKNPLLFVFLVYVYLGVTLNWERNISLKTDLFKKEIKQYTSVIINWWLAGQIQPAILPILAHDIIPK